MKTTPVSRIVKSALIALIACALGSPLAFAQATRTWVSGVGDDVNPCSRTAPCKTFAGAISKTAVGGEISVLDPGGFGTVTITKPITIDGGGFFPTQLASGVNGVVINITVVPALPNKGVVHLRNLNISGASATLLGVDGIRVLGSATTEVDIENCTIFNFSGQGVDIQPTSNCRVNIKNCIIRNCGGGAVQANPQGGGSVAANISKCSLNSSVFGFRADNNVKALLDDCVIASNTNNGILVAATSAASEASVSRCAVNDTGNVGGGGVAAVGGFSTVRIFACDIFNNGIGVLNSGGNAFSSNNNSIRGNTADTSGAISGAGLQ